MSFSGLMLGVNTCRRYSVTEFEGSIKHNRIMGAVEMSGYSVLTFETGNTMPPPAAPTLI
jgi:hypothetical protein